MGSERAVEAWVCARIELGGGGAGADHRPRGEEEPTPTIDDESIDEVEK